MSDAEEVPTSADEVNVGEMVAGITAAINRPRQGSLDPDDGGYCPPLDLPGFGDSYDDCGEKIPHMCPECGATPVIGRTCGRSVCPRCADSWVIDPAVQITAKAESTARLMSSKLGGVSVKKHHVIFSPPEDWYLEASDPLDRTFEVIKEILDVINAEGAVMYHGWSGNDQQEDDRGAWKNRLFNDRSWEDVRAELMPRPHFHAVLVSPFIPGQDVTDRVHSETGWVIHRIADDSGKSLDGLEDVARAPTYSLSHTSIDTRGDGPNRAQYRKFGSTWHDASVYDNQRRKAEHAVRKVAPKVLGIPAKKIRCEASVEDSSGEIDLLDEYSSNSDDDDPDLTGDDGSDDDATSDTDDHNDVDIEPCKGAIVPLSEAPKYLEDDEWIAAAPYSEHLRLRFEEWQDESQRDNPPPMVAAFS